MFFHIDIDSFFISAERSKNPKLLNKPAAVGSRSNLEIFDRERNKIKLLQINSGAFVTPVFHNNYKKTFENYFVDRADGKKKIRGIITTASYEARACGVKTGMAIAKALQLCPQMVVVPANYPLYHKLSRMLFLFLKKQIPQVEQYSIDEFFGNVDGWIEQERAFEVAKELQEEIFKQFKLPVSIGIAKAKYIAKLATEFAKPFGVYEVKNHYEFIKDIPIEQFPGIGKGFSKRLRRYGIKTLGELCQSKKILYAWKLPGIELYNRVCDENNGEITLKSAKKSIGLGRTFDALYDINEIERRVVIMARHIAFMVHLADVNPTKFGIKFYLDDGKKIKFSIRSNRIFSESLLKKEFKKVVQSHSSELAGVMKIRVWVSNFAKEQTPSLLTIEEDTKQKKIDKALMKLRKSFGIDIVKNGNEI